jgi:hypothetical protein
MIRPSAALRENVKRVLLALSLANLIFIREWSPLLHLAPAKPDYGPSHSFYEALSVPPSAYGAMVTLVLLVALGLWLVGAAARRFSPVAKAERVLWILGFGLFLYRFFSLDPGMSVSLGFGWRTLWTALLPRAIERWALPISVGTVTVLVIRYHEPVARVFQVVALILSPLVVNNFYVSSQRALSPPWRWAGKTAVVPRPSAQRVVWFVFDKWDYRETFVEPSARVKLPALEAFRKTALVAERAYPPAQTTDRSFSSYLLGETVREPVHWAPGGFVGVGLAGSKEAVPWGSLPNLFRRLQERGKRSAAFGFFLPYCRLLSDSADECSSMSVREHAVGPYREGVGANMLKLAADWTRTQTSELGYHPSNFIGFRARVREAVRDGEKDLVFVHWPIPHEPYLYDSERGTFPLRSERALEYADNLNLVDTLVGELEEDLKASGLGPRTLVLLTSDHPAYRRPSSGGAVDPRVPFLLRVAGQKASLVFSRRFSTLASTRLVEEALGEGIGTVQQAVAHLEKAAVESPGFEPVRLAEGEFPTAPGPAKGAQKRRSKSSPHPGLPARSGPPSG